MGYCGDSGIAAPPLSEVTLDPDEVEPLFQEVMRNINLMLSLGLIHGDLSAYNILYWQGRISLIDFPQVTDLYTNPNAQPILKRDVRRICDYFARYGFRNDADTIASQLWDEYAQVEPDWEEA
jgi:RIO kinase 1